MTTRRTPHDEDRGLMYGQILDSVRGLRWRARRPSRLAMPGIHQSRVRGTSAEFTEYRPYRAGDDLRRVDWKLFARSDRAHVRISEERAVTPTWIIVDASASMNFPEGPGSKWALAQQLTVALVAVAHAGGDPAGVMVAGHPRATIQPRARRGAVTEVIRMLHDIPVAGASPLSACLALASRATPRIAIVSDFLGDLEETMRVGREIIASGRDVYALHVVASEEIDPPGSVSLVSDPEAGDVRRSVTSRTRGGYLQAYADWREETAARWLASGAAYRVIVTGAEPVGHAVRRIVHS
ncbi:MAG: DUF58 domain-containing protein [Gemmatimonadaceae bacterium]